jgi:hypothetical protein
LFAGGENVLVKQQIRALKAEGFSVREIARELGLSRMKVHRMLAALPPADIGNSPNIETAVPADPTVALLTEADMAWLRVSAAEVSRGLNALERYRIMGLPAGSAAGDEARALFDSGRGEEAFIRWLYPSCG